jgi:hypothetical protein
MSENFRDGVDGRKSVLLRLVRVLDEVLGDRLDEWDEGNEREG